MDADLNVLVPDGEVTIGGEKIAVREYRFLEGLRVEGEARAIIADLGELFGSAQAGDIGLADLRAVFGRHPETLLQLIALATGKPAEWIGGLDDADGHLLLMVWWGVNGDFFTRRLATDLMARRKIEADRAERERLRAVVLSDTAKSSPDSSATATAETTS